MLKQFKLNRKFIEQLIILIKKNDSLSITPLFLDRYKIDPALATGLFITTINDILGLIIYFLIGQALL